jgi:hypothetical protein
MLQDYFESAEVVGSQANATLAELARRAGFNEHSFTLCTSAEIDSARTFVFPFAEPVRIMVLPSYVSRMSDTALRGVIAHEIGHVRLFANGVTKSSEHDVDVRATEWVGYDAMIVAHRETLAIYAQLYPDRVGTVRYRAMEERLDALIAMKKRRDSS